MNHRNRKAKGAKALSIVRLILATTPGLSPKVWTKSYGRALVRIRGKFSDEALWIGGLPTNR